MCLFTIYSIFCQHFHLQSNIDYCMRGCCTVGCCLLEIALANNAIESVYAFISCFLNSASILVWCFISSRNFSSDSFWDLVNSSIHFLNSSCFDNLCFFLSLLVDPLILRFLFDGVNPLPSASWTSLPGVVSLLVDFPLVDLRHYF